MLTKKIDYRALAGFFAEHTEKDDVISAVFAFFKLDCLGRSSVDPSKLDELIRVFNNKDTYDVALLGTIIEKLHAGKESIKSRENALIKTIVTYVDENLFSDISIEQIAENLNISYYYMCHVFKEKYGMTVNEFRNQKRLEKAMKLLASENEKISNVAIACGFNNVSYFTEAFRKITGVSPTAFRTKYKDVTVHNFCDVNDIQLLGMLPHIHFMDAALVEMAPDDPIISVHEPDDTFAFLHEAAIIEYHGVLYASWYNCKELELEGYTPICGKRSYDGGKSWSDLEILCEDKQEKILYCPPVYGIDDDKLYMLVNQMVAPDHIHALDLYILNTETDKFEWLWSRPIPFKLNTNVVTLPNGKRMLPGRVGELDCFPNTPAVLISDSGKIDAQWRLVKVAPNGDLPDGKELVHPEISVICENDTLYMFCRNDLRNVPLVYISKDFGESWSGVHSHDIPYISSKIYAGNLLDGRKYLIANIDELDRSRLALYVTDRNGIKFVKKKILFDKQTTKIVGASACHYPAAFESNGKLHIIATINYEWSRRGAVLFVIDLNEI